MKIKKILSSTLGMLALAALASCGGNNENTTTAEPKTTTEVVPTTTAQESNTSTTASTATKVSTTLKLTKSYNDNSSFIDNGIGYATLQANTDGDTATFRLTKAANDGTSTVRIRFYNVDTPESTGSVEKWGKGASKFTAAKLNAATSIILESPTTPASHDSYGERYLGWIWYKTAEMTDYVNLNLEIVENGFSEAKTEPTDKYYNVFKDAEKYAKENHLHLWGDEIDPYYNDEPLETTVKELVEDLASSNPRFFDKEENFGFKVSFVAYVKSVTYTTTYSYVAEALNEDGTKSTINLYGGYPSDQINSYLYQGSLVHFVGTVQLHNGSYQVAIGGTYVAMTQGPLYTYNVQKPFYVTFDESNDKYQKTSEQGVKSYARVKSVEVNDDASITFVASVTENSAASTFKDYTFNVPAPATGESQIAVGSVLKLTGYLMDITNNVVMVLSYNDISFK